ncbi:MAG: 30S ribosomal protein S17 [Candidatus Paceibacterota bacterium]
MRKLKGKITSDKMDKTRVVEVNRLKKHNTYLKYFNVSKKLKAHDENNAYKEGDEVIIEETRPISKGKKWVIVSKVKEESK